MKKKILCLQIFILSIVLIVSCTKKQEEETTTTSSTFVSTTSTTVVVSLLSDEQIKVMNEDNEKTKKKIKNMRANSTQNVKNDKFKDSNPEGEGHDNNMGANFSNDDIPNPKKSKSNKESLPYLDPTTLNVDDILTVKIEKDSVSNKTIITGNISTWFGLYPLKEKITETEVMIVDDYGLKENTLTVLHGYTNLFVRALNDLLDNIPADKRSDAQINIVGHADASYLTLTPDYGTDSQTFNQILSDKRANGCEYLLKNNFHGISIHKIMNKGGLGFSRPIYNSDGTVNQKDSSRIEISIIY